MEIVDADDEVVVQAPGWVEAAPFTTYVSALTAGVVERIVVLEGDEVEATVAPDDAMGGKRPSPEKIEEFAKGRWEALLMTLTGFRIGEILRERVSQDRFRQIVLVAFLIMGGRLIATGLL